MEFRLKFFFPIFTLLFFLGCTQEEIILPSPTTTVAQSQPTPTISPTNTSTITPTITPTSLSFSTLVFYGDSSLAIGEAGDGVEHVGYSFVTNLRELIDPIYTLITANYGGRTAKWAYENLEDKVFSYEPDLLTLWWGLNDLGGCPGFFDRETNRLLNDKLNIIINDHIASMSLIIDSSSKEESRFLF